MTSLNLLSLTLLTTLLTLLPSPTTALSSHDFGLSVGRSRVHARLAEKNQLKKRTSQKCRSRTSSSAAPSSTHQAPAPKPTASKSASQPAQTHSSSSSSSSDSSSGLDFFNQGSKLGLAWADGGASYISNVAGPKMIYTWGPTCPSEASNLGMTCLPQLWGWKDVNQFQSISQTAKPPLFLTFNEPNELGQSNMDVGSGIQLWRQAVKPLTDQGHKVGSPATSSNPDGLTWVKNFQEQCSDCIWDVTCVHWYDTTFEKFQTYLNLWHTTFNKPVMVTEFALQNFNGGSQPTLGEVFSFMQQAIPWMDSQDWIIGYFPFGYMAPPTGINANMNLLNGDGSLTSLGSLILNESGSK